MAIKSIGGMVSKDKKKWVAYCDVDLGVGNKVLMPIKGKYDEITHTVDDGKTKHQAVFAVHACHQSRRALQLIQDDAQERILADAKDGTKIQRVDANFSMQIFLKCFVENWWMTVDGARRLRLEADMEGIAGSEAIEFNPANLESFALHSQFGDMMERLNGNYDLWFPGERDAVKNSVSGEPGSSSGSPAGNV